MTPTQAFLQARAFLMAHRDDYEAAYQRFAWPKLGQFNWALDWVLDQHKEKTPRDPTIREKFNTYRFADHKERVIDLLKRVTTVSVRTVEIVEAMRATPR